MTDTISLATAQAQLALWIAASAAVSASQQYEIETDGSRRRLTRADAAEIRQQIIFWESRVARCLRKQNRRGNTRYVVPE
jgi:hypothetical protein